MHFLVIWAATAVLTVVEPSHDFGVIPSWRPAMHTFILFNETTNPVTIADVVSSCSCTTAITRSRVIPPRATAEIDVTFDPTGLAGAIERVIDVRSERETLARLHFTATVAMPFAISPRTLHYDIDSPTRTAQRIGVDPRAGIECVDAPSFLHVGVGPDFVDVTFRDEVPVPRGRTRVMIHTTVGDVPVPIDWSRTSRFSAPERLMMIARRSSRFEIVRRDGSSFRVTSIHTFDRRVRATVSQNGRMAMIRVSTGGSSPLRLNGMLRIATDAPDEPEVRVPLIIFDP